MTEQMHTQEAVVKPLECEVRQIISATIGFNFEPRELQSVNADDLLRLAAALSERGKDDERHLSEDKDRPLTAMDRLRLHLLDPETFEFHSDDLGGVVADFDALRADEFARAVEASLASQERIAQLERALQMIEALDSYIDATPRGERKVRKGDFAQIAAASLAAPERIVGAAK